nr:hypothetical protein [Tanacetum cinerariifolium]
MRKENMIAREKWMTSPETTSNISRSRMSRKHTTWDLLRKRLMRETAPKCTKCQHNNSSPCTLKCHKCGKIGHYARDCKSTGNTNATNNRGGNRPNPKGNGCFVCGDPRHFKRDCPKLKNNNGGNRNAQGWVYVVGNAERNGNATGNPDSNVVK